MRTFSGDQSSGRFLGSLVKNNILFQRIRFSVVSVPDVSLQVVERVTVYDGIWQDDVANSSCDLREHIRLAACGDPQRKKRWRAGEDLAMWRGYLNRMRIRNIRLPIDRRQSVLRMCPIWRWLNAPQRGLPD
jgi:hypothetical protein